MKILRNLYNYWRHVWASGYVIVLGIIQIFGAFFSEVQLF